MSRDRVATGLGRFAAGLLSDAVLQASKGCQEERYWLTHPDSGMLSLRWVCSVLSLHLGETLDADAMAKEFALGVLARRLRMFGAGYRKSVARKTQTPPPGKGSGVVRARHKPLGRDSRPA